MDEVRRPARGGLRGSAAIPGDKSISHRAAILGAMAEGETVIRNFLAAEDPLRTLACLKALGVGVRRRGTTVRIRGRGLTAWSRPRGTLDAGNSGTTLRLMLGVLAAQPFRTRVTGDASLRRRPMGRVAAPLTRMGARIAGRGGERRGELYAPLTVEGGRLTGRVHRPVVASAQVKSALLLAGLWARGRTEVVEPWPSRDHTERLLRWFGAAYRKRGRRHMVLGGRPFSARPVVVPGDVSSAAFLLAAATVVPGSRVTVRGVGVNPGRTGVLDALRRMGARLRVTRRRVVGAEPVADLEARSARLRALIVRPREVPRLLDELPLLAALASTAEGTTVIRGARELRVKESDRIRLMARELRRLGADILDRPDGWTIRGVRALRGGAACQSGGDHRVAMALAVAALAAQRPVVIRDTACVETSFPGFFRLLRRMDRA